MNSHFVTNLLQLIDILCLLDVELQDVQDTSEDVQHGGGDAFWGVDLPDNTIGVLKPDRSRKLGGQGFLQLVGQDEWILGEDATVLKELRIGKLGGRSNHH